MNTTERRVGGSVRAGLTVCDSIDQAPHTYS